MPTQNDLAPPRTAASAHLRVVRSGCPGWCLAVDCSGGHVSPAQTLDPRAGAAVGATRVLVLDDGGPGATALSLVSLGVQRRPGPPQARAGGRRPAYGP